MAQRDWHGDRAQVRALLRFDEEELKHQELFRRAETELERSCGYRFGRYFDELKVRVTRFTAAFLEHPPLARFLLLLAFEWGTQRHYVESMRDQAANDPLYVDVLRAHWLEEAQHTKWDTLEIARLAAELETAERGAAFENLAQLGGIVDASLVGQASAEVETLQRVTGRTLSDAESAALQEALHRSLSAIVIGVSLTHPSFVKVAREVSAEATAAMLAA